MNADQDLQIFDPISASETPLNGESNSSTMDKPV